MNVDGLFHLPAPLRRTAYFGLQRLLGSDIAGKWRAFQAWAGFSSDQLDRAVEERLSSLLHAATNQSPYYRELGLERKKGESAPDFLRRFPILSRETVRARFRDIVIDPLRDQITGPESVSSKSYDWLVVKTGGTTGVPTSVIHDASFRDWGRASRLFSQKQCGFPLGTRYFRLWGSETDLLEQHERVDRRVLRNLLGEIPMNAFRAKEAELIRHLKTFQDHPETRHLMAYVDAAAGLASFVEERNLARPGFKTLMACAGTVTTEWRALLERVFQTEVFDKYGSRECGDIACECREHTGLHVYSPNVFLELVDPAGQPCSPGQTGRILVSLLPNLSFPMIRYEIGDLGVWTPPGDCPCGIPFPRLASIEGRADDMLLTEDGTWLSSVFIRHFVGVSLNRQLIREWQLEQATRDRFIFRYQFERGEGLDSNLSQLEESFRAALGRGITIEFVRVAEIPASPSGKTRWIVSQPGRRQRGIGNAEG